MLEHKDSVIYTHMCTLIVATYSIQFLFNVWRVKNCNKKDLNLNAVTNITQLHDSHIFSMKKSSGIH